MRYGVGSRRMSSLLEEEEESSSSSSASMEDVRDAKERESERQDVNWVRKSERAEGEGSDCWG